MSGAAEQSRMLPPTPMDELATAKKLNPLGRLQSYEEISLDSPRGARRGAHLAGEVRLAHNSADSNDAAPAADNKPQKTCPNRFVWLCALCASMNSAVLGYELTVMGGAILFVVDSFAMTEAIG